MKIQKGEFLARTSSLVCVETIQKKIPKSLCPGRVTKKTILLKISNLEANLEIFKRIVRITCIFSGFFSPFPDGAILENCIKEKIPFPRCPFL
jgi:hypothetical protein